MEVDIEARIKELDDLNEEVKKIGILDFSTWVFVKIKLFFLQVRTKFLRELIKERKDLGLSMDCMTGVIEEIKNIPIGMTLAELSRMEKKMDKPFILPKSITLREHENILSTVEVYFPFLHDPENKLKVGKRFKFFGKILWCTDTDTYLCKANRIETA